LTLKGLAKRHPNAICIVSPAKWNCSTGFCVDWKVMQTVHSVEAARKAIDFYNQEGLNCVAVSTCDDTETHKALALPPDMSAAFYRCYYNSYRERGEDNGT
jgi:hypothetical protein